ncbi:MAG: ribose-phosphate diphosphokinase [Candidatus Diapherotrites archaeon]|nr:ribose-phosphate diphosphokinase [Candidatus Diapherotrites archaeon]
MQFLIPLSHSGGFEKSLRQHLKAKSMKYSCGHFPDGELHMRFEEPVRGKEIILVQSLYGKPNDALIELVFAAKTLKRLKARKVTAVIPYLAYMRQDKEFHPGECVSAQHMSELLNGCLDELVAVDPHLHRIRKMSDAFTIPAKAVISVDAIAAFIQKKFNAADTVIVGPDWESFQWARKVANRMGAQSIIFSKHRFSARRVKVQYSSDVKLKGKNLVLIDDMISTGHTMVEAMKELKKKKPKAMYCVTVHGLFLENGLKKLRKAGAKEIFSCNTVPSSTNAINVAPWVARALNQ